MSNAEFKIEPVAPAHYAGVARLVLGIQRDEFGIPATYEEQPDLHDIAGFFRRGGGEFWVALAADAPVGTVGLLDIGGGQGALRKMFVARELRGENKGLAQQLLNRLLGHATSHGIHDVFLGTIDKFVAAHRFYAKNGFAMIDQRDLPAAFPRMHVDEMFFRRRSARS
ncbi:MAG: GNAT family N-acetyltransferase [Proteobacteria bacterium]|nr:GNAT family N-acetyltransferase [Pseudomonadota bacterium]